MTYPLIIGGLWAIVLAAAGGLLTTIDEWYRDLRKPSWQPPDWAFGPAWTIILALGAWSAALGWTQAPNETIRTTVVVLFVANGVFHIGWSLLFFKLRRPDWALMEVTFLWLSILAPMLLMAPFSTYAAWALAPYLAWVAFAAFLNLTIVRLNRPFAGLSRRATSGPT